MNIISVGIDLAKNVIAVPGVNDNGKPVLVKPKHQQYLRIWGSLCRVHPPAKTGEARFRRSGATKG